MVINQEDRIILNIYEYINRASKYEREIEEGRKLLELQGELDKSIIITRNFNTPLSITDQANRQKIIKNILSI